MNTKILIAKLKDSALFKDSFWAIVGSVLGKGLSLIAGIAVARFLGKEVYGEYGMIKSNLILISTFSTFGLGYTATKFIAQYLNYDNEKVRSVHRIATRITLFFSIFLALLVFVFASPIAKYLEGDSLVDLFRLSSFAIVFNAITTTQIGELSGLGRYKRIALNNTYAGVFTFITSVAFTYLWGIDGAAISLVLSLLFNSIINWYYINKYLPVSSNEKKIKSNLVNEILSFSFPVALQESTYSITHWLTMIILVKFANYGEIGLNSAAGQWGAILLFIPGALRNVALSYLSGSAGDKETNKQLLTRLVWVNLASTAIPFLFIALLSSFICSLYGDSYVGLQAVLLVVSFNSLINAVSNVYTQALMAKDKNWFLFFTRLCRDILSLVVGAIAIFLWGNGALMLALSCLLGQLLYLITLRIKILNV